MPRTIEGIVESHRVARERVRAGLPVWARQIDIKSILRRDQSNETPEHAAAVANEIGALLRTRLPPDLLDHGIGDWDMIDIVEGMEQLKPSSYADDPSFTPLQDLNNMLDSLYDWADRERVWLGI